MRLLIWILILFLIVSPADATQYYMATAADGGSDAHDGLSPGSPWLSPNHAGLNCIIDTITAKASTAYSNAQFTAFNNKWGVVTCPSGHGTVKLACETFLGCAMTIASGGGIFIDQSYWQVEGFHVINNGTSGSCFSASPFNGSTTIHDIVFDNDYADGCPANGFSSFPKSTTAGVDYFAVVGVIARDAAKSTVECDSGISIYEPIKSDSAPGTHQYVAGSFVFDNKSPLHCNGGGGGSSTYDGDGIVFDDFGSTQSGGTPYNQQAVAMNNITVFNGGYGVGASGNGSTVSPMYFTQNTISGNLTATNTDTTTCGELTLLGPISLANVSGNLVSPQVSLACAGTSHALYALAINGGDATDTMASNYLYSAAGNNTLAISSPGFSFGTNVTGTSPAFANPVDPGQPNCSGKTSVPDCMSTLIANYTPATTAAKAYGYQIPSATPVVNPYFPQWLCNVNLPAGLVTSGCVTHVSTSGAITINGSVTIQ